MPVFKNDPTLERPLANDGRNYFNSRCTILHLTILQKVVINHMCFLTTYFCCCSNRQVVNNKSIKDLIFSV